MNSDPKWMLDPQLAHDTVGIGDLSLCRVVLMNDANYPWLVLVPRRSDVTEIIDLAAPERIRLMEEIAQAVEALKTETACDKINVAAIGNVVAQLHVHVVARFRKDAAWPKPVWGAALPHRYEDEEKRKLVTALRRRLLIAD
jgi:diadenosine tetraphosphate (Ap4A) HIT family hydrolase